MMQDIISAMRGGGVVRILVEAMSGISTKEHMGQNRSQVSETVTQPKEPPLKYWGGGVKIISAGLSIGCGDKSDFLLWPFVSQSLLHVGQSMERWYGQW
jgi:hypothetical protein